MFDGPIPPSRVNPDPALRKAEAAQYLGRKSPRTIDRYIARGLLKPVVLGPGVIGIRRSELERFLAGDDQATIRKRPFNAHRDEKGRIISAKAAAVIEEAR